MLQTARKTALRSLLILLLAALGLAPATAALPPAESVQAAEICEYAAATAAAEAGIPAEIMGALTLTETGRRLDGAVRPWAWSVNAEGAGSWFDDPASALAFAEDRIAMGRPNVDIGCFQINYRWHGENFASVAAMFDPMTNARYAARFVRQLYDETGDWRAAAGAFHSRTPANANKYLARFDELHALLRQRGPLGLTSSPETYNQFAVAAPLPEERVRRAREKLTLLGAPIGTPLTGMAGSLAVIGDSRGSLLGVQEGLDAVQGQPSLWASALLP
ncbi:lytic transglycosylase domain-containing protein [Paracoccus sp. M683]|uniref:lytic transglycosylase domain-containing protein n=1 Tax=Paracoccus sp. M683 TaxID=2594268 RepID=UPI00117FE7CB|nr:lytic transglycosylase domain-containing protein [Paracoccus sp. M683]TRW96784.1 lytic transglycosylase domain-containing protein [Paracoccus sp. M683]